MDRVGKFQLRKVLGKGASGTVYLALDTFTGNDVALKILDAQVVASPDFERSLAAQFLNEASLAGKLSHPHIAAILEASVDGGAGYIALEYVPGGNLTQYTAPGRLLSPENAIQIAFKCCGALDYAFRQGIIHRDLKPANVMVASGTNIKIADFGAAYLKSSRHAPGETVGTPYYMSPEQVSGAELDHHSDMFSLGVVLYELFTGQRPFAGESLEELFANIDRAEPRPPSALRPELGPELGPEVDRLLLRMLAKAPAERFPGWAEAALEIARIGRLSVYQQGIADSDKFGYLRRFPLVQHLGDAELWELVHAGRWQRVPPRQAVVREGEAGETLFFLATGQVKVTKQGKLLSVLSAGECFGEMAYVKGGALPRQASVEAMTDAIVAEFDAGMLLRTSMNCQLQLSNALLHLLVERLALANERMTRPGP
ncbi:MAG TPA: serine/threonine-protein kinase [Burkholderiales bacterium]|nr:serine/threonine-protein kinase [Burkholderiales bacterium]